jgi:KUP system potassium uptake protein
MRPGRPSKRTSTPALVVGALGVVFGDIGTSPLYAFQTVFTADHNEIAVTPADVYGVVSLVFWSITIIVSVKYVTFVMRAGNDGEGGIMALTALIQAGARRHAAVKRILVVLGILGAALFYGDAVVTPAISVLSAVEGLQAAAPSLDALVLPVSVTVLALLFVFQRYGTGIVGNVFGPVMATWFAVLGLTGAAEVARHPEIVKGLSPSYGLEFLTGNGMVGFIALASVVLAVTGAEALYADMGHFGRSPIRRAWFLLVFPALTLNYLAQGSLLLRSRGAAANLFYLLTPHWAIVPMVVLATAATVIASQAVISGAFSVTRQAMQLGFLPRLAVRHTSSSREGQVYLPTVNWSMCFVVIALVVAFGSSARLASAYGVAVSGTFVLNTILFLAVARLRWHTRARVIALGAVAFLSVELTFFAATLTKVVHGGWLPLGIGIVAFFVMTTWRRGHEIVVARRARREGPLRDVLREVRDLQPPVQHVPGTAVFLNADPRTTPLALRANVEHNHVLHEAVITLSVQTQRVPHVPDDDRLAANDLGDPSDGVTRLIVRFGYQDHPDVPAAMRLAAAHGFLERDVDPARISYFVSNVVVVRSDDRAMNPLRERLYLAMARNAVGATEHFRLESERTVVMSAEIAL